jgi:uncharacterized membrane protein YkvA (DUF1232 family)
VKLSVTGLLQRVGVRRFLQIVAHLPSFAKLFLRLIKDPRVGFRTKLIPLGVLAYLILPTDLVPDFLPIIGQVDDLLVIFFGLKFFLRFCPKEVVQEHVRAIAAGR